ncbi:insert subdomain of RNA polymerase alpha subunit [Epithele typhae]|uniref:insert subdomain of RNA polymerase alpha subunit n=1 Tax=Epithele typhae TaxID=378194 RepID=UPI0020075942|nr:insert subdomain of RNA polymerase alpha subunit [Epithele typhae]KAH9925858.1 insert subdomain of RNA polymerase alpha subunit [Epithele typhae]
MASSSSSLPSSALNPRRHVGVHAERVSDVASTEFPGHYPGEDHSWNLDDFKKEMSVSVKRLSQRSVEFDLVGVDASIANAFRRVLIAEVPTIAIEDVYVHNNTSVIQDEVLAQRIGLIPLNVDPRYFEYRPTGGVPTDRNTLVFQLNVQCERARKSTKDASPYIHEHVTSGDLVWVPQGEQESVFADKPAAATNKDIVLAKLRPGQVVDMELHAIKGVGKEHAKWSPVATATYRLHPLIVLNPSKPVPPEHADKFAKCFSPGVIKVGANRTVTVDERYLRTDTVSREALRHKEFEGCVELKRIRDWFIFSVESEGPYTPQELFPESVKVMRAKIAAIRVAAEALLRDTRDVNGAEPDADGDVEMESA